ncbi:Hypothetical_protein [Hexamita inflata]|uniref:Hypothetical_protein n=1 Tax=Hexamita inflata TaxID=28002 RepID=A0AA86V281_9EUKA|nr:Hypothetical protein HINF_LOCUS60947 [Hexamita inflata]
MQTIADAKQETKPFLTKAQKKKLQMEYQKQFIQKQRAKEDIKATKPNRKQLIEQLFQQVCGRRLIELRGLFYVINFVETKQCQACQYFHFAPNKNNANNE